MKAVSSSKSTRDLNALLAGQSSPVATPRSEKAAVLNARITFLNNTTPKRNKAAAQALVTMLAKAPVAKRGQGSVTLTRKLRDHGE